MTRCAPPLAAVGRALLVASLLFCSACRDPLEFGEICPSLDLEIPATVRAPYPFADHGGCAEGSLANELDAVLEVEGRADVPMALIPTTLQVTGDVPDLPIDAVYPVLLTYSVAPAATTFLLAYRWDAIDLTDGECLSATELDDEERLLVTPAEVAALLAGDGLATSDDAATAAARAFARAELAGGGDGLDADDDGCPNLAEACRGTLLSPTDLTPCPW